MMNRTDRKPSLLGRWLRGAGLAMLAGAALAAPPAGPSPAVPFWGEHQGGIATWPIQHHTYFAVFDLTTGQREDVVKLLQAWTAAAARMAAGETAQPLEGGLRPAVPAPVPDGPGGAMALAADTGEAIGMATARLTVTFGFGAGLFIKDGQDRYGLAARRPVELVDMPKFFGDQLSENRTGGDLSIQACAEDPQVAFHAVRQLARIAEGVAQLRWVQTGFRPSSGSRHLFGFSVEGMENPSVEDPEVMGATVWSGAAAPAWMRGGSYLVVRRMRFALEHWDHMSTEYQENAVGGAKYHGKPLVNPHPGQVSEAAAANIEDDAGHPPSHLEIVARHAMTMFRRSYSYNDGMNFTSERWPPWRQGLEYDAGMLFICYQRDGRTGFIPLYQKMSTMDFMMNQFWTHEGSGIFACPRGVKPGEYLGQDLFQEH
jgi:deferrochelatase/peroxidase EfeB